VDGPRTSEIHSALRTVRTDVNKRVATGRTSRPLVPCLTESLRPKDGNENPARECQQRKRSDHAHKRDRQK
jgi:hypothetical protein